MSSYLNIYMQPKAKDSKPMLLLSVSRNSDLYQQFNEHYDLYSSTGELKEITEQMISAISSDLLACINKAKDTYCSYLEAKNTPTEEISSHKEYIKELEYTYAQIEFLKDIIWECKYSCSDFEKMVAYID